MLIEYNGKQNGSSDLCSYTQQILIFSRLLHLPKTYLLHLQNRITMLSSSQISFEDYRQVHGNLSALCLLASKPSMLGYYDCQPPWSSVELWNREVFLPPFSITPNHLVRSVQLRSRVQLFATLWIAEYQPPCPSPTPGVHLNSHPSSWWCHPAISSSVVPFSSCPQSLPASVFSNEPTLRMR